MAKRESHQDEINDQQSKEIKNLKIEQGYTDRYVQDCFTETKERKMIISGIKETAGEDTANVALGCLNKVISTAISRIRPEDQPQGLKKLSQSAIDNVFRVGKVGGNRKRNISLTFMRVSDKEMVYKAKAEVKEEDEIRFFLNDDVSAGGRSLKAKMRRIVTVAKEQGIYSKLSGNKVIVGTRSFASNELHLLPVNILSSLKQEKSIDDGIVYRGELSVLSNFYPAPFVLDGSIYAHVEQYFQQSKALHHNEAEVADRIMELNNPLHIKSLGDSIESNPEWSERRMLVLYDGVRAKFEQNLALQEELLATQGKHLYEATTDMYYGCGIGYDSNRWQKKNWMGQNVAGLVVKKVRDELLGIEPDDAVGNDTLTEIMVTNEDTVKATCEGSKSKSATTNTNLNIDTAAPTGDGNNTNGMNAASRVGIYTQTDELDNSYMSDNRELEQGSYDRSSAFNPGSSNRGKTRGRGRGKGRGKGRGARGFRASNYNQHWNSMSAADRSFLGLSDESSCNKGRESRGSDTALSSSAMSRINKSAWKSLTKERGSHATWLCSGLHLNITSERSANLYD